jgi:hypothetical protein
VKSKRDKKGEFTGKKDEFVTAENADYVAHQIEEEDFQTTMNNLLKKS